MAVLTARKQRVIDKFEACVEFEVARNDLFDEESNTKKRYSISSLIHTDMDIDNLLAFESYGNAANIDVGMTSIKDWNTLRIDSPAAKPRESVIDAHDLRQSAFKELLFAANSRKYEDIEQEAVAQHGFGENSYATHELNVFIRSPSQLRLRMCLPGFSFQRNQKRMHEMIRAYGAITDVEKSVDSQVNQLFKSVA